MIKRYVRNDNFGISALEECEGGDIVTYEYHAAEVARLNEQVRSLAAENDHLKYHLKGTVEFCYDELPETPATDAILREVREQAVDDAFTAIIEACASDDEIDEHLWNHGVLQVQSHMEDYADRIRKGEQS